MAHKQDTELAKAIGRVLTSLRKRRFPDHGGKKKCADEFGVHQQVWGNWEKALRVPTDQNQQKLAEFFTITLAQLRGEEPLDDPETTATALGEKIKALENELARWKAEAERLRDENRELIGANKILKELHDSLASRSMGKPRSGK